MSGCAGITAWLQQYFPGEVPEYISDLMKEEGIATGSIFQQITASELEQLCSRVKIGHRVSLRNAYRNPIETGVAEDDMVLTNVLSLDNGNGETSEVNVYERKPPETAKPRPQKRKKSSIPKIPKSEKEFVYIVHCCLKDKLDNRIVQVRQSDGRAVKRLHFASSKTSDEVISTLAELFHVEDYMDSLSLVDSSNQPVTFSAVADYVASQRRRYAGCTRLYLLRSYNIHVQESSDSTAAVELV